MQTPSAPKNPKVGDQWPNSPIGPVVWDGSKWVITDDYVEPVASHDAASTSVSTPSATSNDSGWKGFADQTLPAINPMTYLRALRHPYDTAVGLGQAQLKEGVSALGNAFGALTGTATTSHPVLEAARHGAAAVIPLVGPQASHLVDIAESGHPREAAGGALGMLLTFLASKGLGAASEAVAPALARTSVGLGLRGRVPPNTIPEVAQTVLDEGIVGKGSAAKRAAQTAAATDEAALAQGRAPSIPARDVTQAAWDQFVGEGNKRRGPMQEATSDFVAANPHGLSMENILNIVRGDVRSDIPPNAIGQRLRGGAETTLDPDTAAALSRERSVGVVNDAYSQHRPFGDLRAALNIEALLHPRLLPAAIALSASHSPLVTSAVGQGLKLGGRAASLGAKALPAGKSLSDAEKSALVALLQQLDRK